MVRSASLAIALAVALDARASQAAGATLVLRGDWSVEERAAIDDALARIPTVLRPAGARVVARDAEPCGRDGWPADDELLDDRGRIHLCAPARAAAADEAGARAVGRQVALALLFAFDRAAGWSDDPAWRRLNRWQPSILAALPFDALRARAANLHPAGFAEPRGQRSPRWDLVTFVAALLLDPAGQDGGIGCRLISQAAFVRARAGAALAPPGCAAFEDWADLDHLSGVEVVLAAPSTAMMGSLFGHLFLRLMYRDGHGGGAGDGDAETPPHLSRTVAFLADNDVPFTEDPTYALKGIVGSYTASLHERAFLDAYRDYVVIEGRDLRRWRLNLGAAERRALLQRIWTVAHGARYAYYFFRRNCATLMVDLVDDIRWPAPVIPAPGLLAAPPASTLEPWARARTSSGAPLLQFVSEPILSFDHQARAAARHRILLEATLPAGLANDATAAAGLTAALRDTHAVAPDQRAAGYDRLAPLLARRPAGSTPVGAGAATSLAAWLRDSAIIESHLSAVANLEAEERADRERRLRVRAAATAMAASLRRDATARRDAVAARLDGALTQVTAFQPATRLDGYRALLALTRDPALAPAIVTRMRLLALLQSELRYDVPRMKGVAGLRDALLFVDPDQPIDRQPYLDGRGELLRVPCETHVSAPLRALQRAKQTLFAARDGGRPPALPAAAVRDEDGVATTAAARRDYDASLPGSGIDRLALLAGVAAGAAPARAGLVLAGALYDEQLGDHRRFGFPSDTALVVARSAVFLTLASHTPRVAAYDARLFGYRSLRAPLPESGTGRWPLGWELYGTLEGDRARALATEAKIGWGLLAPLVDRGELTDHLLAGVALAYAAYFPTGEARIRDRRQAVSAPLSLELRSGLGAAPRYRSWAAARAWIEPIATLSSSANVVLAWEAGARLELRLAVPAPAHAALVSGQLLRTGVTFTGAPAATIGSFNVGFELR